MSLSRWRKYSEADQEVIRQAAKDSVPFMRRLWDERVGEARKRLTEAGVEVNEVADVSAFAERMHPVWEKFVVTDAQKRLVADIQNMAVS